MCIDCVQSNRLPARIVLDVQQEGSARKLITVRSALVLLNKLDSPVELKMENTDEKGDCCSRENVLSQGCRHGVDGPENVADQFAKVCNFIFHLT